MSLMNSKGFLQMVDTSVEIEKRMLSMLAKKSGLDRIKMACSMYDTGKALLFSGIEKQQYTESQKRGYLLQQMYGDSFSSSELAMIAQNIPHCELV